MDGLKIFNSESERCGSIKVDGPTVFKSEYRVYIIDGPNDESEWSQNSKAQKNDRY